MKSEEVERTSVSRHLTSKCPKWLLYPNLVSIYVVGFSENCKYKIVGSDAEVQKTCSYPLLQNKVDMKVGTTLVIRCSTITVSKRDEKPDRKT